MPWENASAKELRWSRPISNLRDKQEIGHLVASYVVTGDVIGVGSGSTCFAALSAISDRLKTEQLSCLVIPTSHEIQLACVALEIPTASILQYRPDWCFDGADEVDPHKNLIKGRGGAFFLEKLIIASSRIARIIVDKSKFVERLCTHFPVPVEVVPLALHHAEQQLTALGAERTTLRLGLQKDGPVMTENGNFIVDCTFNTIDVTLEKQIKTITGVIESGLFVGYDFEIITV